MAQVSSSVRFPHSRQKRTRRLTSSIALASASASSWGRWRRWNARRCAVRVPTPGRRVSCATRLSTAGPNTVLLCRVAPAGLTGEAERAPLGVAANREPLAGVDHRAAELLDAPQRRGHVLY